VPSTPAFFSSTGHPSRSLHADKPPPGPAVPLRGDTRPPGGGGGSRPAPLPMTTETIWVNWMDSIARSNPKGEADMAEEITKQEAVRRALKAMGRAATPTQMQPYIKEHFGIEMTTDHISVSKSTVLHQMKGGKGKEAKKPAAQGAAAAEGEA